MNILLIIQILHWASKVCLEIHLSLKPVHLSLKLAHLVLNLAHLSLKSVNLGLKLGNLSQRVCLKGTIRYPIRMSFQLVTPKLYTLYFQKIHSIDLWRFC